MRIIKRSQGDLDKLSVINKVAL